MKDCQGKWINMGDLVAFFSVEDGQMHTGKVTKFNETNVKDNNSLLIDVNGKEYCLFPRYVFKFAEEVHNCTNCLNDKSDICPGCEIGSFNTPTLWCFNDDYAIRYVGNVSYDLC